MYVGFGRCEREWAWHTCQGERVRWCGSAAEGRVCGNSVSVTSPERVSGRPVFFFMLQPFSLTCRSDITCPYLPFFILGSIDKPNPQLLNRVTHRVNIVQCLYQCFVKNTATQKSAIHLRSSQPPLRGGIFATLCSSSPRSYGVPALSSAFLKRWS